MKVILSASESQQLKLLTAKLELVKKKLVKLVKLKGRYKHGKFLLIRQRQWFGIVRHRVTSPGFSYHRTSIILASWMITSCD